jgi:hypothetical protein
MSISSLSTSLIASLFKKADADSSGTLTATELDSVAADLGQATGKTETGAELLKSYDTDHDGSVSADEFGDGVTLDSNVHTALLKAQEIMSGATLIAYMNGDDSGGSSNNDLSSMFSSGTDDSSLASLLNGANGSDGSDADSLSALFEQLMQNYQGGASAIADGTDATTDPETPAVTDPTKTESST